MEKGPGECDFSYVKPLSRTYMLQVVHLILHIETYTENYKIICLTKCVIN
jgi:hypothetical protein